MLNTARLASCSYLKLCFPCAESGANVDPVDIIRGATYPPLSNNTGTGLYINQGTEAGAITLSAGTLPTIADNQSFILQHVIGGFSGLDQLAYGDTTSGERIFWNYFISSLALDIVFSGGQVGQSSIAVADTVNPHGYAICRDAVARTIKHRVDGVQTGNTMTDPGGTLNPPVNEMMWNGANFYSICLFIFDGALPADTEDALAWMPPRHAVGDKCVWTPWRTE